VRKNHRQRRYGKVLDTVSGNYGKLITIQNACEHFFLYVLVIASVFQQVQVGLDSIYMQSALSEGL
jgi:hypothetical protein